EQDEIISAIAPTFNLTVIDSQLDSMWYTIDRLNEGALLPKTSNILGT
ncbi:unnamed protein product, partial [marine sediment metagenome]